MNEILNDQGQSKSCCTKKKSDQLQNSQIITTQAANSLSPNLKKNNDMKDKNNV